MLIQHLSAENIYFSQSFVDANGTIVLLAWDDLQKSSDQEPLLYYKKNGQTIEHIDVQNNRIEETFNLDDLRNSTKVTIRPTYTVGDIALDSLLNIDDIYFYLNNKNQLILLQKQNEAFFPLNKSSKPSATPKELIQDADGKLSFKEKSKTVEVLHITKHPNLTQNEAKAFLGSIDLDDLDLEDDDLIGFDCFGQPYLISGEKYKLLNDNKKLKPIKEKEITSSIFHVENNITLKLSEFRFPNVEIIQKMTLKDLEDLLWSVADLIRDKSALDDVMDYMRVSIPLLAIKRLLDIREEFLKDHILIPGHITYESNKVDYPEDYLQRTFKDVQGNKLIFAVAEDKIEWYGVTWDDIAQFIEQDKEIEREIQLKNYPLAIKSKATTRQMFLKEIIDNFYQEAGKPSKIKNIFKVTDFVNKIKDEKKISKEVFQELLTIMGKFSLSYKNANEDIFSNAYMYLISQFASGAGKKGGEFFTPTELIRKLLPFLDIKLPEKGNILIGDPTAGSCSFVLEAGDIIRQQLIIDNPQASHTEIEEQLNERVQFVTQEKGETSAVMGEMNLMFKGFSNHISYNANSINDYQTTIGTHRQQFRYAVGNPPYGLKSYGMAYATASNEDRWDFGVPPDKEGEYAFIETFIDMLDDQGKAGIVLPLGTLFKNTTKALRKKIIESKLLEAIIVLPGAMFQTTQIPVVFWILNKDKTRKNSDKVFMVNASNEFTKTGKFNEWQSERSLQSFLNRDNNESAIPGLSRYVEITEISKKDWNLSVQRYVFTEETEQEINLDAIMTQLEELDKVIDFSKEVVSTFNESISKLK